MRCAMRVADPVTLAAGRARLLTTANYEVARRKSPSEAPGGSGQWIVYRPIIEAVCKAANARFQLHRSLNRIAVPCFAAHRTPLLQVALVDRCVDRFDVGV